MADNILVSQGVGTTISTDDVGGGVQVQRVKAQFGVDGTATDVSATNPMPVSPSLATGAATGAKQDTGNTSLASIDSKVTGLSQDATMTAGNQIAIVKGGAKGATTAGVVTSTAAGTDRQLLDMILRNADGTVASLGGGGGGNTYQIVVAATILLNAVFTRPADTTAYTALDVVSNSTSAPTVLSFPNAARVNGGSGYITKVRFVTNQAGNVARYRIHFFHTTPTAVNDNAPYTTLYANALKAIGSVDIGPIASEGTGSDAAGGTNAVVRLPFVVPAGSNTVFALVETLDGFTPASGQSFTLEILVEQN